MASYFPSRGKIRAQVNINGQRESKTFDTKTEAKAWATRREYELQAENGSARITFLELARAWVRRYPQRKQIDWESNRLEYLLAGWLGETMLPKLSGVDVAKWSDNVFVEPVWRTIKYERVYLRAYDSVSVTRKDIAQYIDWYNKERGHSSIEGKTPEQFYSAGLPAMKKAA